MPVYAQCPACGLVFESRAMKVVGSAKSVSMSGNTERCPRCGSSARLMEGIYDFDATGTPEMISGPEWSRNVVELMQKRLREIQRIADSARLTDEEAKARIEQIVDDIAVHNPAVAAQFRTRTEGKPRRAWSLTAKAIASALAAVGAYNTLADFADRVTEIVRYFGG